MSKMKRNAKGEGSFTVNPNGSVTHRKCVGYKDNGQRKVFTVTAKTKSACIREMKKRVDAWNNEKSRNCVTIGSTITELCYKHLQYQINNGDLKSKSIDRRECTIENQIRGYDLGYMQIHMVTSAEIERHIDTLISEKKISGSSIIKVVDVLNAAYDWAFRRDEVEKNPVYMVKPELTRKIKRLSAKGANDSDVSVLSEEEVKAFEQEALSLYTNGKRKYPSGYYCLLLLHTGMRVGEMLALRWKDWQGEYLVIDKSISMSKNRSKTSEDDRNFVSIEGSTKNQKARTIQLTEDAKRILYMIKNSRINCDPEELITPTSTGKVNTASNMEHRMKTIMKNAELTTVQGGLHIFRKTFATRMYENGARVEEIAAYIGDLESTTRKYYIAIRKKVTEYGEVRQVVRVPSVREEGIYVA